jgi:DNA-binding protein
MAEEKPKRPKRRAKAETPGQPSETSAAQVSESVVFIGNKPVMNYVLACMTCLNSGSNRIVLKARGRAIPRAVDTVEVLRRSFSKGVQLQSVNLSTEEVARQEGQKSRVSAIEIAVMKQWLIDPTIQVVLIVDIPASYRSDRTSIAI